MADMNWGQGLKGAAGGALAGGSIGGPIGAGIGGLIGGGLGLFGGGNGDQDEMRRRSNAAAFQMGPAAQSQYSSFRGNQADLVAMLEAQARGEGPSLAQAQLQKATDRNQKGQQALAAGAQGPNAMLAQFQAMQNSAGLGAQASQDAAIARMQEQFNAQSQLGGAIGQARYGDEANNQFNAAARNQNAWGNLQAQMENRGQNNSMLMNAYGASQTPGLGDQLMAGGAGMFSQAATAGASNVPTGAPAPPQGFAGGMGPAGGAGPVGRFGENGRWDV